MLVRLSRKAPLAGGRRSSLRRGKTSPSQWKFSVRNMSDLAYSSTSQKPKWTDSSMSGEGRMSSHLDSDKDLIQDYLERKGLEYKIPESITNQIRVKDCPFCHDTQDKPTNQYKLYIYRDNGTYNCYRCGVQGSWIDFQSKLNDLLTGQSSAPARSVAAPTSTRTVRTASPSTAPRAAPRARSPISNTGGDVQDEIMARAANAQDDEYDEPPPVAPRATATRAPRATAASATGVAAGTRAVPRATSATGAPIRKAAPPGTSATRVPRSAAAPAAHHDEHDDSMPEDTETRTSMAETEHTTPPPAAPRVARSSSAVPRAPATAARPTLPQRNMFATDTDGKAQKLPDQAKMQNHIANLAKLPDIVAYMKGRGLKQQTIAAYKVGGCVLRTKDEADPTKTVDHQAVSFFWLDNRDGQEVAVRIKTRAIKEKSVQRLDPQGGGWGMFGWHLVTPETKSIIITEGEFDAMAVYQETGEVAVSLPAGANCFPIDIVKMLERFDRIVLWLDDDHVGQEGAKKFANKLGKERCLIVQTRNGQKDGPKDANDALKAGLSLKAILATAAPIPHQQIMHFREIRAEVKRELVNADQVAGYKSTTFPGFTNLLKGHRKGELTVVTGPTGIGKTSVLAQLSLDFAQQGVPTLWGSFEITNVRLVKKLIQQYANKNLEKNLDDFAGAAERFSQLPLYFMRYHGGTDIDAVLDAMEYAVYVHDVEHVILDNLQFMTPSNQMKGFDKFDILDTAVARLRKFATYRNIHISLIIHPRKEDDGTPLSTASVFGSAKATQEADNVVIVQRGKTYRYLDITKNRFSGDTGKVPYSFDPESLKYTELTEEEVKKADRENRPKRGRGSAPVELEAGFGLS